MLNIDDRLIKEVSPKIGPNALSVLLAIAIHLNQKTNRCFPSHDRLMQLTGIGRDGVYKALDKLKAAGLLVSQQAIDSKKKTFGRRTFKLSTSFIKIFVDACDAEPLPENPDTVQPDTVQPDTANQETYQLNKKEQINNKEQIRNEGARADSETGPRHSDKPQNLETDTDLFKQIGEYYKANPNEWTDGVCQVLPGRYSSVQLKSMLEEYVGYAFAWRNKYATFAQHHAEFKRWVKRQPTMQKEQAAPRPETVNPNIPRYT